MAYSLALIGLWISYSLAASPLGDTAQYQLDRNPQRTSSFIRDGKIDARITAELPEHEPPSYELTFDYQFQIDFIGSQQGREIIPLAADYFEPAFLEALRETGHYEGPDFKLDHLGFADAKTLGGKLYERCDKIKFYDITNQNIQKLVLVAHVYPGVPVLGAVKVDVSGVYEGLRFKAGGDYFIPATHHRF